ncbi:LacI family transcriptional regulator [Alteromonadaceae bacterium 2753L.S.0a.02]|nr:LacI family transcriptional regulator [Alteromonadaceae bacterium 2753L.S.0a.02]
MPKATISDVASAAGVSRKTVSRVLNNEAGVKPETQQRVIAAMEQLGYAPNMSARRLRSQQSYQVGLLFRDFPGNFYSSMMISGAIKACDELGYDLLIRPLKIENENWANVVQYMLQRSNPDGLIVVPPLCDDDKVLIPILASETPMVKVAAINPGGSENIHCDELSAARNAVQHLISLGHTRIGIINCLKSHAAGEWRQQGYQQALAQAGIFVEPELQQYHVYQPDIMEQSARRLLGLAEPPTAIFATSDTTAALLYRVASQLQFRIPYDLSIVGFDDEPLSSNLWPPLTTVRQPVPALGKAAVSLLVKRLIQGRSDYQPEQLSCELIIRHSTGPVVR